MSGRGQFDRYRIIINLVVKMVSILPSSIQSLVWDIIKPFSQKVFLVVRYAIFKDRIKCCGDNVYLGCNISIKNMSECVIGDNVSIHNDCYIDGYGGIEIGDNVSIAHGSSLVSFDHTWSDADKPIKYNDIKGGQIKISSDVWIGARVVVLANVNIARRVVVAANSVVKKGVLASCSLYAGVPAKKIKDI